MDKKDLLKRIRERYKLMQESDHDNRMLALEDMKFATVPGSQWDDAMKKERGERPCYEFNRLRINGKKVINEIRANMPSGKVRPTEDGDKQTAETIEGLIRNIASVSDIDSIIDFQAEYLVFGGMAAWRVNTEYAKDDFFQDVCIESIANPFCLYADPACKDPLKRDAEDWILTERIPNAEYERKYGKAKKVDFESSEFDDDEEWQSDETTRIAEYWYKEQYDKTILQVQTPNGTMVVDAESEAAQGLPEETILKTRTYKADRIMMCIASGDAILEGPTEWAGGCHPFVQIHGEYIIVDGKPYWYGLGRWAKDSQVSYNVSRTAITETIAMAPQAKFWATPEQADGHTLKWAEAHKKNFPFLTYNADPKAPGPPVRMGGADVPVALIQESQIASKEIDDVTGIYGDDRGQMAESQSGRAILARQQQGRVSTFNFPDNVGKGIQRTWELLIDLIPKIYDTERSLRVLGADGAEDYIKINTFVPGEDGAPVKVNDLTVGKYDVTVTVGPSFSTRRQEAAETYQMMIQANPAIFPAIGDLVFKSMDVPFAEEIAERFKALLPPEIQRMLQNEETSPEVQQAMMQAEQAMQAVQMAQQEVQQAAQELQMEQTQTEKAKSEVEKLIADLKTEEARFEARVAKEMARLAQKESGLKVDEAQFSSSIKDQIVSNDRTELGAQIEQSMQAIGGMAQEFMASAQEALQAIEEQKNDVTVVLADVQQQAANKPRVIRVESRRENGKLVAIPIYEETGPH